MDPVGTTLVAGFFSLIIWFGQRTTTVIDRSINRVSVQVERLADEVKEIGVGLDELRSHLRSEYVTQDTLLKEFARIDNELDETRRVCGWYDANVSGRKKSNIERIDVWADNNT